MIGSRFAILKRQQAYGGDRMLLMLLKMVKHDVYVMT